MHASKRHRSHIRVIERDRFIYRLWQAGKTLREIAEILKLEGFVPMTRQGISLAIKRMRRAVSDNSEGQQRGMSQYRFDAKRHIHYWGDKPLTGITEALKVISKGDAVVQWAVNLAVDALRNGKTPEEAKRAWKDYRQSAADAGTDTHAAVEELVKRAIHDHGGYLPRISDDAPPQLREFHRWARQHRVRFLESEKHLWSTTHWIGGICDLLLEMDGKRLVGDIKTGKDIYPEYFLQMAGYRLMLEEMGVSGIQGAIVILLPRDGGLRTAVRWDYETDRDGFLAALRLYRTLQTFATK